MSWVRGVPVPTHEPSSSKHIAGIQSIIEIIRPEQQVGEELLA